MPNLRVENFGGSLKILYIDNTDLTRNKRASYLTEDVVSAGTTIRIQSIVGFEQLTTSSGQIVILGEIGNERTEIVRTSSATSPSAAYKEVTLSDALAFDHPQDTKVYIADWDRVEFQYAASATGTKTTISAYPLIIQPDQKETLFQDKTTASDRLTGSPTTAFYFARFNNRIDSRNSAWTDPVYGTGYDDNSVFAIKRATLNALGEEIDGNIITHEFLNEALWEARREYHESPGKRPFRRKYNTVIGTALTGSFRIELPTDVERPHTAENVYGVRIGAEANMSYYDKKEWDFDWRDKPHSTLDLPYTRDVSTSIWLANGRDFAQSGSISVEGTDIAYTKATGSNNSLTITTHGGWSASAGSDAYQNISLGLPYKFTVFADPDGSAYIYFNQPIDTAYINQNIFADYYRTLVGRDSDGDVLDEPSYDMYKHYLMAKIKHRKNKGATDITQDSDYKVWQYKKNQALSREVLGADIRMSPDINHLPIPE